MDSEKTLNLILSQIFNATTEDEILIYDDKNGRFVVGGNPLSPSQTSEIIEAANQLDNNILLKYLLNEVEYSGTKRMALKAGNWDEVRFPKANLYVAHLIRTKINTIKVLQVRKPKEKKVETETKK